MEEKSRSQRWLDKWEKDRTQNKWKYYFMEGCIKWGLPVGLLVSISNSYFIADYSLNTAIINFVCFFLGGLLYGKWMWHSNEKRYQQYKDL